MYCSKCRNDYCESCRQLKSRNDWANAIQNGICYALGIMFVGQCQVRKVETTAIEHHAAHYDQATGAFKWNDETEKPK